MNFSVNTFFEKEECNSIIEFMERNGEIFSYDPREVWDCRRIYDDTFKEDVKNRLLTKFSNGDFKLWFNLNEFQINDINISLTKYYDGRWLDLHLDSTSQFTTVIVLNENFEDGRFSLSETPNKIENCQKIHLNMGESISFNGSKTYHGVLPVTIGIRYALNIWMTNTDFKYRPLKNKTTLI